MFFPASRLALQADFPRHRKVTMGRFAIHTWKWNFDAHATAPSIARRSMSFERERGMVVTIETLR
jgi:hypothetical protein